jgi:hypothetical protein
VRHDLREQGGVLAAAFSPDGSGLATGGSDSTAIIWDMTGRTWAASMRKPAEEDVAALAGKGGFPAMARLVRHPAEAVRLLSVIGPAKEGLNERTLVRLAEGLGDEDVGVRRRSRERLEREAPLIAPLLDEMIKAGGDREMVKALVAIRAKADGWAGAGRMREYRAVEVLEKIGTKEALGLLRSWSRGNAGAALTIEAKAALARLGR